jgi:hypothetical protein
LWHLQECLQYILDLPLPFFSFISFPPSLRSFSRSHCSISIHEWIVLPPYPFLLLLTLVFVCFLHFYIFTISGCSLSFGVGMVMHFPLTIDFAVFHSFWYVVFCFHLFKKFLNFLFYFFINSLVFKNMLFNLQIFVLFLKFCLSISSFISLYLEKTCYQSDIF